MKSQLKARTIELIQRAIPLSFFLWLLGSCTCFYYLFYEPEYRYALYIAFQDYFFSFLVSLLLHSLPWRGLSRLLIVLTIIGSSSLFFLRIYFLFVFKYLLKDDHISAILNSNVAEATEFFQSYLDSRLLLSVAFLYFFLILCFVLASKVSKCIPRPFCLLAVSLALTGGCSLLHNSASFKDNTLCLFGYFIELSRVPSLTDYYGQVKVVVTSENQPSKIVLIIGESLAKGHCYTYGYEKNTTPQISRLVAQDEVIVYQQAMSAAVNTIPSFLAMMSTYKPDMGEERQWYECPTLPEIIRKSDYHCMWITNQAKKGLWDNEVTKFAELCDSSVFVGAMISDINQLHYDELVLPAFNNFLMRNSYSKEFYFIHLMGSHPAFSKRFPPSFRRFQSSDYLDHPINQRQVLADYDNSVLYNDSIVSTIINKVVDEDALLVYFPDHGLDVFQTFPNHASHGIKENPTSFRISSEIPMYLYCSPQFKSKHEDLYLSLKAQSEFPFCTSQLIEWVMHILSCQFSQ